MQNPRAAFLKSLEIMWQLQSVSWYTYTILHVSRLHLCRQFPSLFVSASLTALYFSPCFWVWREAVSISQSPPNTRIFRIEPWRVYLLLCGSTRTKHQTKMNVQHQWPWILFMDRKTRGKALGQRLWDIRKPPHLCSSSAVFNFRVSGLWRHLRHPGKGGIMWDPYYSFIHIPISLPSPPSKWTATTKAAGPNAQLSAAASSFLSAEILTRCISRCGFHDQSVEGFVFQAT